MKRKLNVCWLAVLLVSLLAMGCVGKTAVNPVAGRWQHDEIVYKEEVRLVNEAEVVFEFFDDFTVKAYENGVIVEEGEYRLNDDLTELAIFGEALDETKYQLAFEDEMMVLTSVISDDFNDSEKHIRKLRKLK